MFWRMNFFYGFFSEMFSNESLLSKEEDDNYEQNEYDESFEEKTITNLINEWS